MRAPPTAREAATNARRQSAQTVQCRQQNARYIPRMLELRAKLDSQLAVWRGRAFSGARERATREPRARRTRRVARRSATRPARAHSAVHLWDDGVANSLQGISMCAKLRGRRPGCTPRCGVARAAISTGCLGDVATTRLAPINPPFLRRARSNAVFTRNIYRCSCARRPLRLFLSHKWFLWLHYASSLPIEVNCPRTATFFMWWTCTGQPFCTDQTLV